MHEHSPDEVLAVLAGRQHGVVSVAQMRWIGLGESAVRRRVAAGRLHRIHRGVYAVGHTSLTRRSHEMAAVLACGPGAALSHRSAGRLWGILTAAAKIEVTCARSRPPTPKILTHCSPLATEDRAVRHGIPLTTVARTVIDLADVLPDKPFANAVHEAEVKRLFDLRKIDEALKRVPGRRGRHRLERTLAAWRPRPFTRNDAERLFLDTCEQHGLPAPRTAVNIAGHEVDFLFDDVGVVVELDGAAAHHTRRAFEGDRRRDRILAAHGLQVVRVTWLDLERGSAALAEELKAIRHRRTPC